MLTEAQQSLAREKARREAWMLQQSSRLLSTASPIPTSASVVAKSHRASPVTTSLPARPAGFARAAVFAGPLVDPSPLWHVPDILVMPSSPPETPATAWAADATADPQLTLPVGTGTMPAGFSSLAEQCAPVSSPECHTSSKSPDTSEASSPALFDNAAEAVGVSSLPESEAPSMPPPPPPPPHSPSAATAAAAAQSPESSPVAIAMASPTNTGRLPPVPATPAPSPLATMGSIQHSPQASPRNLVNLPTPMEKGRLAPSPRPSPLAAVQEAGDTSRISELRRRRLDFFSRPTTSPGTGAGAVERETPAETVAAPAADARTTGDAIPERPTTAQPVLRRQVSDQSSSDSETFSNAAADDSSDLADEYEEDDETTEGPVSPGPQQQDTHTVEVDSPSKSATEPWVAPVSISLPREDQKVQRAISDALAAQAAWRLHNGERRPASAAVLRDSNPASSSSLETVAALQADQPPTTSHNAQASEEKSAAPSADVAEEFSDASDEVVVMVTASEPVPPAVQTSQPNSPVSLSPKHPQSAAQRQQPSADDSKSQPAQAQQEREAVPSVLPLPSRPASAASTRALAAIEAAMQERQAWMLRSAARRRPATATPTSAMRRRSSTRDLTASPLSPSPSPTLVFAAPPVQRRPSQTAATEVEDCSERQVQTPISRRASAVAVFMASHPAPQSLMELPTEILLQICQSLSHRDLGALAQTCQRMAAVCRDPSLYPRIEVTHRSLSERALLSIGERRPRDLLLRHCRVSETTHLRAALAAAGPRLRTLSLASCTSVTDTVVRGVSRLCRDLQVLDLTWANISNKALQYLAKAPLLQLHTLRLSHCAMIGDRGISALVAARGPQLRVLDLSGCLNLTSVAVDAVALCCPNLRELRLAHVSKVRGGGGHK